MLLIDTAFFSCSGKVFLLRRVTFRIA